MAVLPKPHLPWQALSAHLQLLHAALPSFEGAVLPALLALFHDNRALCAAAPRALIHDLVRMHCADRPPPLGGANAAAVAPPSSALAVLDAPSEQARGHSRVLTHARTCQCMHMPADTNTNVHILMQDVPIVGNLQLARVIAFIIK